MRTLTIFIPGFFTLLALATVAAEGSADPFADQEKQIIALTNQEREALHLPGLKENDLLRKAAMAHSENMARQNTLSHELDGQSPQERVKAVGYEYVAVAENVAYNQASPQDVVDEWMNSPGHRANIVNKDLTEIGVGIFLDADGNPYYTQVFGRPRAAGMTASASFTVRNETSLPVRIGMIDETQQRPTTLISPGGSGKFNVAGMGKLPKMRASSDEQAREFDVHDGATFVIRDEDGALDVTAPEPAAQAR